MMNDKHLLKSEIDEQAAWWFSRSQARRLTRDEQRQLADWRAASSLHEAAFQEIQQIWGDCLQIARPADTVRHQTAGWLRPLRRCGTGLFFALALLLPTSQLPLLLTNNLSVQTADSPRDVVLTDGSRVYLNRQTKIRVQYGQQQRQLWLEQGEVYLSVAANKAKPFTLYAGESQVRVVGTEFDVRFDGASVAVAVRKGIVAMMGRPHTTPVLLHAGDLARQEPTAGELQRGRRSLEEIGDWRQGQLLFRNRPLGDLAAELNRYRSGHISLASPDLAEMPVSGTLDLADPDAFLTALPLLLNVSVVRDANGNALIIKAK